MKRKKLVLGLIAVIAFSMAVRTWGAEPVVVEGIDDGWIREADPTHALYEADGISVWSSYSPDGARRYGLLEFDLSSLSGQTFLFAVLDMYSPIHGYSDYEAPIKQSAYVIDCSSGTPLLSLNWNSYMSEKDAGKQALEILGAYDLPAANTDPSQQDQYVPSYSSVADMAKIQAAIDGNGKLSLVFIAAEDGTNYGQSWGDGEATWVANPPCLSPRLKLYTERPGGPVTNVSPADGASFVHRDVILDWDASPPFYNEPPTYTVYIDTDRDPNNGTIVNINDSEVTSYDPDLAFNTKFWWRVDVTDPNNGSPATYKGQTWSFTTEPVGIYLPTSSEIWIRESDPDRSYEDDAIWVANTTAEGELRYGLIGFDVSGFTGQTVHDAYLQLYSANVGDNSGELQQDAYVISSTGSIALEDLTWNTYMKEKDPNKIALGGLGVYDLPDFDSDPSQQDAYIWSQQATPADLALLQAAIDGNGQFSVNGMFYMVLIAKVSNDPYARMWGDGAYGPGGPQPRLILQTGAALNPTPPDEAPDVDPGVVMSWEVYPELYSETPTFTVYLDDDPDLSDATPIDNGTSTSYDPTPDLNYETPYWWRVDVTDSNFGDPITYPGTVWTFTTKNFYEKPTLINPQPTDDLDVDDVLLEWSHPDAGEAGVEFKISYGLAGFPLTEVATVSSTSYDLGANVTLEWGTVYNWRIDVVVNSVVEREGDVWSFTTHTLQCIHSPHDVTGPDGVPDCFVDLFDFASFASDWLKCGIDRDLGDCIWPRPGPEGLEASAEVWIRELAPDSVYENDLISVWSSYNDHYQDAGYKRYGLIEFDLSGYTGQTVSSAKLYLWSFGSAQPIKQEAYKIVDNITMPASWNSYMLEGDPNKVAFESFGTYDLPAGSGAPSLQDAYAASGEASSADLALIQSAIDGDGVLRIVLIAAEDGTDYRIDWGDGPDGYDGGNPLLDAKFN